MLGPESASPAVADSIGGTPSLAQDAMRYPPSDLVVAFERQFRIVLTPLTPGDMAEVGIAPEQAQRTALLSRSVGNPGPNATGEIAWTETGFTYLGRYTAHDSIYGSPEPPYPAYLVQVLAPPFPGFPGQNTALVVIDAQSGELAHVYGPCVGDECGAP